MMQVMAAPLFPPGFLATAWDVLLIFLSPIGAGIPSGVIVAQERGMSWQAATAVYFFGDLLVILFFEPLMLWFIREAKRNPKMARVREALLQATNQIVGAYGVRPGPFLLVVITFGSSQVIGRAVARIAGHGFFVSWAVALLGDMLFYLVIMASTLWLNGVLGNGTWTAIIITVAVIALPPLVQKLRGKTAPRA